MQSAKAIDQRNSSEFARITGKSAKGSAEVAEVWKVSLSWHNPYSQPRDGLPRTIWEGVVDKQDYLDGKVEKVKELEKQYPPGNGFAWGVIPNWGAEEKPRRRWSKEAVSRNRINRLTKRLQKKYPLFWEPMRDAELLARPGYFAAVDYDDTSAEVEMPRSPRSEELDKEAANDESTG